MSTLSLLPSTLPVLTRITFNRIEYDVVVMCTDEKSERAIRCEGKSTALIRQLAEGLFKEHDLFNTQLGSAGFKAAPEKMDKNGLHFADGNTYNHTGRIKNTAFRQIVSDKSAKTIQGAVKAKHAWKLLQNLLVEQHRPGSAFPSRKPTHIYSVLPPPKVNAFTPGVDNSEDLRPTSPLSPTDKTSPFGPVPSSPPRQLRNFTSLPSSFSHTSSSSTFASTNDLTLNPSSSSSSSNYISSTSSSSTPLGPTSSTSTVTTTTHSSLPSFTPFSPFSSSPFPSSISSRSQLHTTSRSLTLSKFHLALFPVQKNRDVLSTVLARKDDFTESDDWFNRLKPRVKQRILLNIKHGKYPRNGREYYLLERRHEKTNEEVWVAQELSKLESELDDDTSSIPDNVHKEVEKIYDDFVHGSTQQLQIKIKCLMATEFVGKGNLCKYLELRGLNLENYDAEHFARELFDWIDNI